MVRAFIISKCISKLKDLRIDNTLEINCTSIKFVLVK